MRDNTVYKMQAELCKALAHPTRLEVLAVLQNKELCFSDILGQTGGLKSGLSQHLSIMVENGILHSRKDSRCNYFKISSPKVLKACNTMREILADQISSQKAILKKIKL